jgi:carboxymethylenebutenolidase
MGQLIEFAANGHHSRGYLATPPEGRAPAVLVIQEWWGLVDHIQDVCDRLAAEGFVALAPDLYHGKTTRSPDEAGKLFMALNIARAGADLRGAAEALLARAEASGSRVGVMGFCMGGQLALYAGMQYPDRVACVVDFYGVHPRVPIDPSRIEVPVQAHFARRDQSVREADARALVERIEQAGGRIEAFFYDADHAFFNDTRPTVYDRGAAATAWKRTLGFLREQLGKAPPAPLAPGSAVP